MEENGEASEQMHATVRSRADLEVDMVHFDDQLLLSFPFVKRSESRWQALDSLIYVFEVPWLAKSMTTKALAAEETTS